MEQPTTKVCVRCNQRLPLSEFFGRSRAPDGRQPKCKKCERAYKAELRSLTPADKAAARDRVVRRTAKACTECGFVKPLAAFPLHDNALDGHRNRCLKCDNARRRARKYGKRTRSDEEIAAARGGTRSKRCTRCDAVKPLGDYYVNRTAADGLRAACKECDAQSTSQWRTANEMRVRLTAALWREQNAETHLEATRAWQRRNPERISERRRQLREEQGDKIRARQRGYYRRNAERIMEASSRRRALKMLAAVGAVDLDALWTGRCGICDLPMDRDLVRPNPLSKSIDHITPLSRGGTHDQANLQWAHLVCNQRKGAGLT